MKYFALLMTSAMVAEAHKTCTNYQELSHEVEGIQTQNSTLFKTSSKLMKLQDKL
jgi:hypothetical protein